MKKILLTGLAILAIGNSSLYADENSGLYIGLGYASTDIDLATGDSELDALISEATDSALILVGYDFNEYIGIEGRYYWNISSIGFDYYLGGTPLAGTYEADSLAMYVKPQYSFDMITLYGLLGVTKNNYTAARLLGATDDTLFSWGVGAKLNFTQSFAVFVDYTDLGDSDKLSNAALSAWDVGISYKF